MYAYYSYNNEIIGYYSLKLLDNNTCELNNLCVISQHRHSNVGKMLLNDAFARIRKNWLFKSRDFHCGR